MCNDKKIQKPQLTSEEALVWQLIQGLLIHKAVFLDMARIIAAGRNDFVKCIYSLNGTRDSFRVHYIWQGMSHQTPGLYVFQMLSFYIVSENTKTKYSKT